MANGERRVIGLSPQKRSDGPDDVFHCTDEFDEL